MSYFNLSNGQAPQQATSFDASKSYIPDNTEALAVITDAEWKQWQDDPESLSLTFEIQHPENLKGRKIFHKLKVNDVDSSKKDKAVRMLAAIYTIAGADLSSLKAKPTGEEVAKTVGYKKISVVIAYYNFNSYEGNNIKKVGSPNEQQKSVQTKTEDDNDLPF